MIRNLSIDSEWLAIVVSSKIFDRMNQCNTINTRDCSTVIDFITFLQVINKTE